MFEKCLFLLCLCSYIRITWKHSNAFLSSARSNNTSFNKKSTRSTSNLFCIVRYGIILANIDSSTIKVPSIPMSNLKVNWITIYGGGHFTVPELNNVSYFIIKFRLRKRSCKYDFTSVAFILSLHLVVLDNYTLRVSLIIMLSFRSYRSPALYWQSHTSYDVLL